MKRAGWVWLTAWSVGVAGCGGALENETVSAPEGEDAAMRARSQHARVVALEGEARRAAEAARCDDACVASDEACALASQICGAADADAHDEGTRLLCEDASPRCETARSVAASGCVCAAAR